MRIERRRREDIRGKREEKKQKKEKETNTHPVVSQNEPSQTRETQPTCRKTAPYRVSAWAWTIPFASSLFLLLPFFSPCFLSQGKALCLLFLLAVFYCSRSFLVSLPRVTLRVTLRVRHRQDDQSQGMKSYPGEYPGIPDEPWICSRSWILQIRLTVTVSMQGVSSPLDSSRSLPSFPHSRVYKANKTATTLL